MSILHLLEDFTVTSGMETIPMSDIALEEQRLEAFESGYNAGWQDSVKAANDEAARIASDFAGNLQDLSFTMAEARADLLTALHPLITGMVNSVLPYLAQKTLGERVIETLDIMARNATDGPVRLVTSPANAEALQALLDDHNFTDATINTEPSLGEGQVHIRAFGSEQEIDLDAVLKQIDTAVTGFFEERQKDTA